MRKKIIAGNWKMNNDAGQSAELIAALLQKLPQTKAEVIIAPSFVNLALAVEKTKGSPIVVAAQNMHFAEKGAFTGEVSASMLEAIGVRTTILGHSERREYFNETDESLAKKVDTALAHQFRIIFCIGEKLAERKAEKHFEVGETATPEQAQEIHAFIRKTVADKYGKEVADNLTILYGGSCNAKNAASLFANPDVDGGLIGGAALVADDFISIIQAMK